MENYGDIESDIWLYKIGPDFIRLRFTGGVTFLYTYASAGEFNIEQMKILAQQNIGLDNFIYPTIVNLYESVEPTWSYWQHNSYINLDWNVLNEF
jgi:hypothetical protein